MKRTGYVCAALLLFACVLQAQAQSSASPSLQGKVLDPSGGAIVGAQIVAIPDGRSAGPTVVSDQAGQFMLQLAAGRYLIKISAKDFLETTETIEIGSAPQLRDFMLRLSGVQQTVEVTSVPSYQVAAISTATKTLTPLLDVPQAITVVTQELIRDQGMTSVGDVMRYIPGIEVHQGDLPANARPKARPPDSASPVAMN